MVKKDKIIHIELLRILAIFFVIFNHTGERGYFLFADELDSPFFPLYIFLSIACKVAVPIFYMISGALLLDREETIKKVYFNRIFYYIITLIVVSFIYWRWGATLPISKMTLKVFGVKLYSYRLSTQLWYLYSYLGVLVMLPLLRRFVISMRNKDFIYLLVCHVLFVGIIPIIRYYFSKGALNSNDYFSIPIITSSCVFYVLMGYYVERSIDIKKINKKILFVGLLVSMIFIIISSYMTMYKAGIVGVLNEDVSQSFHSCLISVPTITLYLACKYYCINYSIPQIFQRVIISIGSTTFGIFLLEKMLRTYLNYIYVDLEPVVGALPACFLWVVMCVLIGFCITYLLKKVPIIKKFI